MTTPWYDTREGIEERLKTGVGGLREVARARHEAGYERRERMSEWVLLRRFHTDSCGNFGKITRGAPASPQVPPVASREDMRPWSGSYTVTLSGRCLPRPDETCDVCGDGWTLDSVDDFVDRRDENARHRGCQRARLAEKEREYFEEILGAAEIEGHELEEIENGYCPCDYCAPWFNIKTNRGKIKIGWRKRVISIEWPETFSIRGEDLVTEDPVITHGPKMVHAWGRDKAVGYLGRIWRS